MVSTCRLDGDEDIRLLLDLVIHFVCSMGTRRSQATKSVDKGDNHSQELNLSGLLIQFSHCLLFCYIMQVHSLNSMSCALCWDKKHKVRKVYVSTVSHYVATVFKFYAQSQSNSFWTLKQYMPSCHIA